MLGVWDWTAVGVYFALVFGVAYWVSTRQRSTRETSAGYFLAGRNVGWFVIGTSLFASNIGSEHLVGLAGTGAAGDMPMGQYECQASLILLVLCWVFVPFYVKSGVFTMPEFLERRYSSGARWYLAVVSIIGYVLTKISVTVAAGAIVFKALMGIDFWTGAVIVVLATGAYTIFGGLRAVLYTDMLQCIVLLVGSVVVTVVGLGQLGGWGAMCQIVEPSFLNMWRPMNDPNFPWTGILFGAPLVAIWYWCTDQFIVQRILSTEDQRQAQLGSIFAAYLKTLPVFLFLIPGVVAYALTQTGQLTLDKPDDALPTLVRVLLPAGLRGVVVAGLLAALMSSLSSVFNSCSTLITWDIYKKLHPGASERRLVWVGQVSTAVLVVLGLLWVPLMQRYSDQLYTYLQKVQAYISPPITAVFLLGLLFRRINARGAMACLLTGFLLGMGRLLAELAQPAPGEWLYRFTTINFMHFALFLFLICAAVLAVVSLTGPPASDEQLAGLTFQTVRRAERRLPGLGLLVLLSLGILAAVGAVWIYFSAIVQR